MTVPTVFVSGATGVLGRPVVRLLLDSGHRVLALARSADNEQALRDAGAEPVRCDFELASLREPVAGVGGVLHLATHIPPTNQMGKASAWAENDRLRSEGTRNLVDAALEAGARVFVYPSVVFVYADGASKWIEAGMPTAENPILRSTLDAEAEVARFTAGGGRGVVLRMGYFFGPTAGSPAEQLAMARRGISPIPGSSDGYYPAIWVDDAAAAVVAALDRAPAGVYDVVDDEPLTRREVGRALAEAVGRRRLLRPPAAVVRLAVGQVAPVAARSQRVSNRRLKEATGWAPAVHDFRQGLITASRSLPRRG